MTKLRLILGSFIAFCAVAYLGICLRVPIFEVTASGEGQERQEKRSGTERNNDEPATTKHVDLGGGLELDETAKIRNGKIVSCLKRFTRNGTLAMTYYSCPEVVGSGVRTYYQNGKEAMSEEFDIDGRIETLILTDADGAPMDVFEREKDGTTHPVSTERLEKCKQEYKCIKETFGPIADAAQKGDEEQVLRRVGEAIEKLKTGGKGRSADGNKSSK